MNLMTNLTETLEGSNLEVNHSVAPNVEDEKNLPSFLSGISSIDDYSELISFLGLVSSPNGLEINLKHNHPSIEEHREKFDEIRLNAEMNPGNIEKQRLYARWLFFPGCDYESAFRIYCNILKLNPEDPYAHHYIGEIFKSYRVKQADLLFEEGIKLPADKFLHPKSHHDIAYSSEKTLGNEEFQLHYDLGFKKHSTDECPFLKK